MIFFHNSALLTSSNVFWNAVYNKPYATITTKHHLKCILDWKYLHLQYFTLTINYIKSTDEAVIKLVYIVFWQCKRICFKGHRFSAYHTNCFLFWLTVLELFPNVCSREIVCISNLNYMCSRSRSLPFIFYIFFLKIVWNHGSNKV